MEIKEIEQLYLQSQDLEALKRLKEKIESSTVERFNLAIQINYHCDNLYSGSMLAEFDKFISEQIKRLTKELDEA